LLEFKNDSQRLRVSYQLRQEYRFEVAIKLMYYIPDKKWSSISKFL